MTDETSDQDNTLTKVARTVGTALGTVASAVNEVVVSSTPERSEKPAKAKANKEARTGHPKSESQTKAQQKKKTKRLKHRRKLGRKTNG